MRKHLIVRYMYVVNFNNTLETPSPTSIEPMQQREGSFKDEKEKWGYEADTKRCVGC